MCIFTYLIFCLLKEEQDRSDNEDNYDLENSDDLDDTPVLQVLTFFFTWGIY